MKQLAVLVVCALLLTVSCLPLEGNNDASSDAKSAFGVAFDEIVVDTSLVVKRKNPNRQSRTQNVSNQPVEASVVSQKNKAQ
ncbi:hypothetical protein JTB14_036689 [Gonioctena quinquepunctata]|nr:hypothetical protein JTB14_012054 [Gonioctena quinquepunctata]KAG5867301.1 hypothetical protein JTB14_036689 [Gonioctena quinquepunctata]